MNWLKLSRSITDSQVFAHPIALKIWIWCLCRASHKQRHVQLKVGKGDRIVTIEAGQFIFGRHKAEESLSIDGSTIYKWLQKFESKDFEMILIESNNQYSIITICNWDEYQHDYNKKEQPKSSQVTAEEQLSSSQVTAEEHKQDLINLENDKKGEKTPQLPNSQTRKKGDELAKDLSSEEKRSMYRQLKSKFPETENGIMTQCLDGYIGKFDAKFPDGNDRKIFVQHWTYFVQDMKWLPQNSGTVYKRPNKAGR